MTLLLHSCCAPCTSACAEALTEEGQRFRLFWHNPNIHPFTEYAQRRLSLENFAASQNIPLEMIDEYGLRLFLRGPGQRSIAEQCPEGPEAKAGRCAWCYRLRLEKTADYARECGCGAFSTTLLISPYQNHDVIRQTGEEIARNRGLDFFYRDFRPLFRRSQERARELGLYMQKYCGCVFSEEERYCKKRKGSAAREP